MGTGGNDKKITKSERISKLWDFTRPNIHLVVVPKGEGNEEDKKKFWEETTNKIFQIG